MYGRLPATLKNGPESYLAFRSVESARILYGSANDTVKLALWLSELATHSMTRQLSGLHQARINPHLATCQRVRALRRDEFDSAHSRESQAKQLLRLRIQSEKMATRRNA